MKSLIAIVTGLHVLVHGTFGCCDQGLSSASSVARECLCGHAHQHRSDQHQPASSCCSLPTAGNTTDGQSPVPHQCVHESCHWLVTAAGPSVSMPDFFVPLAVAANLPTETPTMAAARFWSVLATARNAAPPLRLHLALGVLLV